MATYPNNILVKGDVVNEVDVYDQNDHNILKGEIVALQTYVGTNPEGSKANLVERLAQMVDTNGAFRQGTAFPTNPVDGQVFYRTDLNTLYVYEAGTAAWQAAQNLSNVIWRFDGTSSANEGNLHLGNGAATAPFTNSLGVGTSCLRYLFHTGTAESTMWYVPWTKLQTVNTLNCRFLWARGSTNASQTVQTSIGSVVESAVVNQTGAYWGSYSLDVSGLDAGTVYDIVIQGDATSSGSGREVFVF